MPGARRLIWLPEAVRDLERLREFIEPKHPPAARQAALSIVEAAKNLKTHPDRGRPVGVLEDFRDVFIPFGSGAYVLRYRCVEDAVVVVRVWHSREDRP